jgi:hydroxyacylglutathione hydrolase
VKEVFPDIDIVGTGYEDIPHVTQKVKEGDIITLGNLKIEVIYTPCHTRGHVVYYVTTTDRESKQNAPILFSGDTLFVGGCGRSELGLDLGLELGFKLAISVRMRGDDILYRSYTLTLILTLAPTLILTLTLTLNLTLYDNVAGFSRGLLLKCSGKP